MFLLPYETTVAGKLYRNLDSVYSKARMAKLELNYPNMANSAKREYSNLHYVTPLDGHLDVPTFTQYINIGTEQSPELLIDGRSYIRLDKRTGTMKVIAENDWLFQGIRMALNLKELRDGNQFYMGFGNVPIITFHKWISGIVTSKYNLSIESQMAISVICCYYYLAMINPSLRIPGESRELEVPRICSLTGINVDFVYNIMEDLGNLSNLDDFCVALSNNSLQQRTGNLKTQDLILLLATSWFGINSRENVAISLEHLATFNSLVYSAITSSLYKRTVLAQRALNSARDRDVKAFVDLIFNTTSDFIRR